MAHSPAPSLSYNMLVLIVMYSVFHLSSDFRPRVPILRQGRGTTPTNFNFSPAILIFSRTRGSAPLDDEARSYGGRRRCFRLAHLLSQCGTQLYSSAGPAAYPKIADFGAHNTSRSRASKFSPMAPASRHASALVCALAGSSACASSFPSLSLIQETMLTTAGRCKHDQSRDTTAKGTGRMKF